MNSGVKTSKNPLFNKILCIFFLINNINLKKQLKINKLKISNQKWLLFFCIKSKLEGFKDVFFYVLIRAGALIGCILQVLKKLLNLI